MQSQASPSSSALAEAVQRSLVSGRGWDVDTHTHTHREKGGKDVGPRGKTAGKKGGQKNRGRKQKDKWLSREVNGGRIRMKLTRGKFTTESFSATPTNQNRMAILRLVYEVESVKRLQNTAVYKNPSDQKTLRWFPPPGSTEAPRLGNLTDVMCNCLIQFNLATLLLCSGLH